ncbi:unnamed protein product [Cylindrotheca closterium]|uniref:RRP15-like protein n=1 Tax=Cylindrotheca closterium TaxID=2856 RepID=A0AAD2CH85_9STRA|nr:unnamed protein product [Cylindrotheca closterium]
MARSKSTFRSKRRNESSISESDLKRFAGSSDEDEDDDDEQVLENWQRQESSDGESTTKDDNSQRINSRDDMDEDDELEPDVFIQSSSAKMSNAMAKILGTSNAERAITSVVLSKTTTPLQKMQMKQKEETKAMREKRRDNRERCLTALHIPLSVATTNTINTGQHSVAKELEQERLHRRVATRGVVALFNAITQHQQVSESSQTVSRGSNIEPKVTKHTFLSKIKNAASVSTEEKIPGASDTGSAKSSKWDALNEDYLLNHKKNWDEESSDGENDNLDDEEDGDVDVSTAVQGRKKRRKS